MPFESKQSVGDAALNARPAASRFGWCALALSAVLFSAACSSSGPSGQPAAAQAAAASTPAVPAEYAAGAKNFLGPSAEVLAFGDLALNGGKQILGVDPTPGASSGASTEFDIVRAAILENQGDTWKEIFRCDERLTNEKGYLIGTPTSPLSAWQLEFTQDPSLGLELKFTESAAGSNAASDANHSATYVVRWNQKVERYECLDKKGDRFLGELPALGDPVPRNLLR